MNEYLKDLNNFNNHRPLLYLGLIESQGDVLELGTGDGSTVMLNDICKQQDRKLVSYDNNAEYINKYEYLNNVDHSINYTENWDIDIVNNRKWGLVFVDHAPGERRHVDAIAVKDIAQIVVIHDTESEEGYLMNLVFPQYKYILHSYMPTQTQRTTMLSNFIDVSKLTIPEFTQLY